MPIIKDIKFLENLLIMKVSKKDIELSKSDIFFCMYGNEDDKGVKFTLMSKKGVYVAFASFSVSETIRLMSIFLGRDKLLSLKKSFLVTLVPLLLITILGAFYFVGVLALLFGIVSYAIVLTIIFYLGSINRMLDELN